MIVDLNEDLSFTGGGRAEEGSGGKTLKPMGKRNKIYRTVETQGIKKTTG